MKRFDKGLICLAFALSLIGCTRSSSTEAIDAYALLVPDFRNDVVHKIAADGTYEGDFLDASRFEDANVGSRVWRSPKGMVYLDGNPGLFWVLSERSLSEWDTQGRFVRTVYSDTSVMESPTGIVRLGDHVFITSKDKKIMLVFTIEGEIVSRFGYPALERAKDLVVGRDRLIYVGSSAQSSSQKGLVSIWNPYEIKIDAEPLGYRIPPDLKGDGPLSVHSLAFDDDDNLLITDFAKGRLERWSMERNERIEILLEGGHPGAYLELARGPDGLVYLAGADGIYRFPSSAPAAELQTIEPFFKAAELGERYEHAFSPSSILFARRAALVAAD